MESHLPPDTEVAGWLHTLGVGSRCQWDVLVFLSCHQTTLLGTADLARLPGYASNEIVVALDVLETLELVERSRVSQGARLYQCLVPHTSPRREALAQLQALTAHRAGRVLIATQLRRDRTPEETAQQARHFLAEAQQRLQGLRRQARVREERRQQWQTAI
jgi:DNA-binding MarR family transcriptional regulator